MSCLHCETIVSIAMCILYTMGNTLDVSYWSKRYVCIFYIPTKYAAIRHFGIGV